jgi:phage gp29-like protein
MANKFSLYTSDDKVDDDATKNFRKKWFRNIIKETVDADFYGFSLVQLGNIVQGCFIEAKIIPRQYVVQQKEGVKKSPANSQDLIYFDDPSFKNWLVPIGDADHLGVLDKAAPLVIKKKEVISAWSEAAEVFGMPIRIGKTNIQDAEAKANMEDMLENMGSAAWGVFDVEDDIELKEASKSDFSNMYDKFIERVNSELSKLVLLQTGTTDEKSFTGAANVHESTLKDVIESYIIKVEDITNEVVIPLCVRHGILPLGAYMKADNEQKVTLKEMFDMVKELLPSYDISEDWISETFDIPIEGKKEVKEPEPVGAKTDKKESLTNIMKAVSKLYPQSNE